jgi:molybdenum cofactor cytidylyltransferase
MPLPQWSDMSIGIAILAAGASTRMGQSKQLLKIGDAPLLAHVTREAMGASGNVVVVLGANAAEHESILRSLAVHVTYNADWQKGMGSSIKAGVRHLLSLSPHLDGILIMVCDQPKVTSAHLNTLIKKFREMHGAIVTSRYEAMQGVPAIFSNEHFHDLLGLDDQNGAKVVMARYPEEVVSIDFPDGADDLDTPTDYARFLKERK